MLKHHFQQISDILLKDFKVYQIEPIAAPSYSLQLLILERLRVLHQRAGKLCGIK